MKHLICLIFCCVFLCSCSLHEPVDVEFTDIPDNYLSMKDISSTNIDSTSAGITDKVWWKDFLDPRLEGLINEGLENNLRIRQSLSKVEAALHRHGLQWSALFPNVTLATRAERSRLDVRTFGNTSTNVRVALLVSYELDLFGRLASLSKSARESLAAEIFSSQRMIQEVVSQIVVSYFTIAQRCQNLDLIKETVDLQQKTLSLVEDRYRAGRIDSLDVYQFRTSLIRRKALRPDFEINLAQERHLLSVMLGKYPINLVSCDGTGLDKDLLLKLSDNPQDLLLKRPDILSAKSLLAAGHHRISSKMAERLPVINLAINGGYASPEIKDLFNASTLVWSVASELALTVFDFWGKKSAVEIERALTRELEYRYREIVLSSFKEVEDRVSAHFYLQEKVKLASLEVESVSNTVKLSVEKYLKGVSDYVSVLLAEDRMYEAKRSLIDARSRYAINYIELQKSLGKIPLSLYE